MRDAIFDRHANHDATIADSTVGSAGVADSDPERASASGQAEGAGDAGPAADSPAAAGAADPRAARDVSAAKQREGPRGFAFTLSPRAPPSPSRRRSPRAR